MVAPCSVNAYGRYFGCRPRPRFKVTICDLKVFTSSCSGFAGWLARDNNGVFSQLSLPTVGVAIEARHHNIT